MNIEHRPDRPSPYKARVRTPGGRIISKSFTSRPKAEQWIAEQKTDMRRGEWIDPSAGDITLSKWLRLVADTKIDVADSTLETRDSLIRNHVDPDLGLFALNRLTPEEIQRWVASLDLAPASVRKVHAIVAEALNLAVARGRLLRNPNVEVKLPKLETPDHRYLTETEVGELADAISPRYRPFVYLGAYAGLRPGEALAARWVDLDAEKRTLAVRGTKTAASRRTLRIPPILLAELAAHRRAYPHLQLVLHNRAGRPVLIDTFRNRIWNPAVERSVGEPMRPYDLRHTHVALLIEKGAHAKVIADRLGHTSIRTTMDTYGHLLEGVEAQVVDLLGSSEPGGQAL